MGIIAEWIDIDFDWAYYINMHDFTMSNARSKVPVGSIVLEKVREKIETGQTFIVTNYYLVEDSGLKDIEDKRAASEILAVKMLDFMKEYGHFPQATETIRTFKNGNVDLSYEPSEYDKFTLRLTPKMVDGNVEDFLLSLKSGGKLPFVSSEKWKVEPAKSGRSKCRTCGDKISKGTLRIGEPSYFQDHLTYKWHHLDCIADDIWGIQEEMLDGFKELNDEDKGHVKTILFE